MPGVLGLIGLIASGGSGEDAAGFVICRLAADECEIISIGVTPERRRAKDLGAKSAFLEVAVDNPAADGLYRKQGFALVGRRPNYSRRPKGRVDALIMARAL